MEKVLIASDTLVELYGLKNVEEDTYLNEAAITMSLFRYNVLSIEGCRLEFTGGDAAEIVAGNIIIGSISGALAAVKSVTLTSGTWGVDAAGYLFLLGQAGVFQAEELKVNGTGLADVAADSTQAEQHLTAVKIRIKDHGLTVIDWVRIEGTLNYDGEYQLQAVGEDFIEITHAFEAERFTGDELVYVGVRNGKSIPMTHEEGDEPGFYDGVLPSTLKGLIVHAYYWRILSIIDTGIVLTTRQRCKAMYDMDEEG